MAMMIVGGFFMWSYKNDACRVADLTGGQVKAYTYKGLPYYRVKVYGGKYVGVDSGKGKV